jgi:hypothetical protein
MNLIDLYEMRDPRDAYQRDYDSSTSGMGRGADHRGLGQELAHERNNIQIAINGRPWKVVAGRGTADSAEERSYLESMKRWAERKSASSGKKWTVYLTGAEVSESQSLAEMDNRTSSDDRKEQRRNRPEEKARQDKEQQERLKSVSPEMRKKLRLPEPKEGVAEGSLNEFAPGDDSDGGEEDALLKFARMWYNGDDATQQQVEQALAQQGWEIGELESEEGGAFVVQSGDEHGDSYIGFAVADLTEDASWGMAESSQRVDSLVTDALKIMQGATMNDAVSALKTILGDREYNGRRGHYSFYVRQLMDMYGQQSVAEADVDSDGHSVDHADSGEYDYEGDQAKDQLNTIVRAAQRLNGMLDDNENMPEWVQMKITNAADYIDTAADYIESNQEPELSEGDKVGNMDADKFDAAMARLKQLAGAGPMKTVWDPAKRVYRNIPTAVQPRK